MRSIAIVAFALLLVFNFSCKKKTDSPTINSTSGNNNPPSIYDSRGILQVKYYTSNCGSVYADTSATSVFFDQPLGSSNYNFVSAGTVTYNDSTMYFNSFSYASSFPVSMVVPQKWNVSGSSYIPAFTYSCNPFFPDYTGQGLLPDTCVKANGLTLNISGISNYTGNSVVLSLSGPSSVNVTKSISGNGTITFTPSELSNFAVNTNSYLEINITNYKIETFSGLAFAIYNVRSHQKCIWMK